MDFHLIDIKTGKIENDVAFTVDDEHLKRIGMNVKNQYKSEKYE